MGALGDEAELKQANAAYSLLEDRYKNKVRRVTWPSCQILSVELVADKNLTVPYPGSTDGAEEQPYILRRPHNRARRGADEDVVPKARETTWGDDQAAMKPSASLRFVQQVNSHYGRRLGGTG